MPPARAAPSVDFQNPLYCPDVSASSYLKSLRERILSGRAQANITVRHNLQKRSKTKVDPKVVVPSFSRLLGKALQEGPGSSTHSQANETEVKFVMDNADDAFAQPPWEISGSSSSLSSPSVITKELPLASNHRHSKRPGPKRKLSFEILHRPAKLAKSFSISLEEPNDALVYIPLDFGKAFDKSAYSPEQRQITFGKSLTNEEKLVARIKALEDFLYGPSIGTESPRGLAVFIELLDRLLPGIRLKARLNALPLKTHQTLADYLGEQGLLNLRVMEILRTSEIRSLSLSNSMDDEDGLNVEGQDILKVFSKPNSFVFLTHLSLSGTPIYDFDLTHIQHLPRLSILLLDNTGIGNEAIYILTSLKRSLTYLTLATNPHINDDSIPALLLMTRLTFLSISDTDIGMTGLRRLARAIEGKTIDIEIPDACERYLSDLGSQYLVKITPPLITVANLCEHLSAGALKRNLAAHAECNRDILAAGTKKEMKDRLENLLTTRELDLIAAAMVFGEDFS